MTKYLEKKKFRILKRNLRTKFGEVDILAQDGPTLVVVEVKTKTSDQYGSPIEMITFRKREKLVLLALQLSRAYHTDNVRIDVATVDAGHDYQIKYFKGIIEANV